MKIFAQQPLDILDYGINLTKWLTEGDNVISATAYSSPTGLNIVVTQETTNTPKVWISGGVDGVEYKVSATVITNGGRTKEFDFKIAVVEV